MTLIDGTLILTGGLSEATSASIGGTLQLSGFVAVPTVGVERRAIVTDNAGVTVDDGTLKFQPGPITWELGRPSRWSVTVTAEQADALFGGCDEWGIAEPFREVQLWRGDKCLTWGPAVAPHYENGVVTVDGADCGWYLERRTIGPAQRPNLFGTDPTEGRGPLFFGLTGPPLIENLTGPETADLYSETTNHPLFGTPAYHIHDATSIAPADFLHPVMYQQIRLNASAFPHTVSFSARCYVESLSGPNTQRSGLVLAAYPLDWDSLTYDAQIVNLSTIDENHPTGAGGSRYHNVTIEVPPADEVIIHARLTGPIGDVYWDDIFLTYDAALEFSGQDQTSDIALDVIDHLHGNVDAPYVYSIHHPNYPWVTEGYGWSDVNVDVDAPASGVLRSRRYFFENRTNGIAMLDEFAGGGRSATGEWGHIDTGFDWSYTYAATQRTFRTHSPRMGSYRPDCTFRSVDGHGNLLAWAWAFDGQKAANYVVVGAPGESKREGADLETTAFANDLTLLTRETAPLDVALDTLDGLATHFAKNYSRPAVLTCKIPWAPFFQDRGLWLGDTVGVRIAQGWFDVDSRWRIVAMTLQPDDTVDVILNPDRD